MEWDGYLRFVLALAFVIGLIALFAALARRAGWGFPTAAIKRADGRRLKVVEVSPLDGRRRLILVRRDDTEHLLMVGPTSELVIETGIQAPATPEFSQVLADATPTALDKGETPK
tara:strand:- start:297 stop:641 length:345 start_codon:yes stop_codon:yes gene_type:complete